MNVDVWRDRSGEELHLGDVVQICGYWPGSMSLQDLGATAEIVSFGRKRVKLSFFSDYEKTRALPLVVLRKKKSR